jgi:hypothetical protein
MPFAPDDLKKPSTHSSNPTLAGALRASLRIVENTPLESPLAEATIDSIDLLLDELDQNLVAGMPEAITDEKLIALIDVFRAQAINWEMQQQAETPKRSRKTAANSTDVSKAITVNLFE